MSINIVFSGIGGVGGYYGGKLAEFYSNSDKIKVYFISRGDNLNMIREHGIHIHTPEKEFTASPALVTDQPAEIGKADYIFCTTKSYDLEENVLQLRPAIGPDTVIIPLLNGVDITSRIRNIIPDTEVWYGCVYIGARLVSPGHITYFTPNDFLWFGEPEKSTGRQQDLLGILTAAGINASNPDDILFRIWKKFFLISTGATLTSFYNQSIGQILEFHRDDYCKLGAELLAIAHAKGINLPDNMPQKVIADQLKMPYDATTSMHTDFRNKKRTELESLTGYVVKAGKGLGIPTPCYEMMYNQLNSAL